MLWALANTIPSLSPFLLPPPPLLPLLHTRMRPGVSFLQTGPAAGPAPQFVRSSGRSISATATTSSPVFDVCVCGGTLGIFLAAALAQKGWKVAVVERGVVAGRRQEWNISRKELDELVEVS